MQLKIFELGMSNGIIILKAEIINLIVCVISLPYFLYTFLPFSHLQNKIVFV